MRTILQISNSTSSKHAVPALLQVELVLSISVQLRFAILHNRKVSKYNAQLKRTRKKKKQQVLLNASIRFLRREKETGVAGKDPHDDARPRYRRRHAFYLRETRTLTYGEALSSCVVTKRQTNYWRCYTAYPEY